MSNPAAPPFGPVIDGVERHLLHVRRAQGLDHGVARHVERSLAGLAQPFAVPADAVDAESGGVDPVRPDLADDIDARIRHAFDDLLEEAEAPSALVQAVLAIGQVQHAAVDADGLRRHAQELPRRRAEVLRRAREPDLVRKHLVPRVPVSCRAPFDPSSGRILAQRPSRAWPHRFGWLRQEHWPARGPARPQGPCRARGTGPRRAKAGLIRNGPPARRPLEG